MSENFDIKVKVDPGSTVASIRQVEQSLAKSEDTAESAARAFAKLGEAIRSNAVGLATQAVSASRSLAQALQTEATMLERATGRSKDFGFQLAALQKLHTDGRISGEQYVETLERMGVAFEKTAEQARELARAQAQQAAKTIGFDSMPQGGGMFGKAEGMLGTLSAAASGGALAGGIIAAGQALNDYLSELHEAEDRYTTLTNKAQKFTSATDDVNVVLARQGGLAAALNSTSTQTIEVYDAIGDATDRLNLSAAEQARITETVGKAAQLGGKSMESAGEIMNRLSVAFGTGADTAGTLRKLFRDFPDLADQMGGALHMTQQEMIKFAGDGKDHFEDFAHALSTNTDDLDESFKKIQRTWAESEAQLKEHFDKSIAEGTDGMLDMVDALDQLDNRLTSQVELWDKFGVAVENGARAARDAAHGTGADVKWRSDFDSQLRGEPTPLSDAERVKFLDDTSWIAAATSAPDASTFAPAAKTNADSVRHVAKEVDAYDKLLGDLQRPTKQAIDDLNTLGQLYMNNAISLDKYNDEAARRLDLLAKEGLIETKSVTSGIGTPVDYSGLSVEGLRASGAAAMSSAAESQVYGVDPDKIREANEQLAKSAEEAAQRTKEAWASGLGEVGANFIRAARDGKESFGDMTEQMLHDIAILILKMSALKMAQAGGTTGLIGTALGGLIGGFANGGSFTVPRSSDYFTMPAAANGNTFRFTGGGQRDEHMFMARVSSDETLEVRTQRQQLANAEFQGNAMRAMSMLGRGGGGGGRTVVIAPSDPREVTRAFGTYAGQREFVKLNRDFSRRRLG